MLDQLIQDFRDKIGKGVVVGPFSKSSDPAFVEVIGHAGFDFVVLDLEHGPNNVLSLQNLIRAAEVSGLLPIVRVTEECPSLIGEVLDVGGASRCPRCRASETWSGSSRLHASPLRGCEGCAVS